MSNLYSPGLSSNSPAQVPQSDSGSQPMFYGSQPDPNTFNSFHLDEKDSTSRTNGSQPYYLNGASIQRSLYGDGAERFSSRSSSRFSSNSSKKGSRVEIANVDIRYNPPVEAVELSPYVMIQDEYGNPLLRENLLGDIQYRWWRGQKRTCAVPGCTEVAELQCLGCIKVQNPRSQHFFCSAEHYKQEWPQHRQWHAAARGDNSEHWNHDDGEESTEYAFSLKRDVYEQSPKNTDTIASISCKFPPPVHDLWADVATTKHYIPTSDDVGRQLLLECAPLVADKSKGGSKSIGQWVRKETTTVLPRPDPPPARMLIDNQRFQEIMIEPQSNFKVMNYNVLAEIYATQTLYPYCPLHALAWAYRRNNIIRDISAHDADIVCLQEVQANHYDKFFHPELEKRGYEGIYKKKTRDNQTDQPQRIDGCAIFYKKARWAVMEQYAIEFNEAAKGHFENCQDEELVLKRLSKGNIALVCVLEEIRTTETRQRRKRRLCVANTHIFWDPQYADVKLWQTWVLAQELQKMILGRDLPLLLCGDFNSTPDSAVYELMTTQRLRDDHPILTKDKLQIFRGDLSHNIPLASSYANVFGVEPPYTNYTGNFKGCLDYIFFTKNHLLPTSVLRIDEEEVLSEQLALPSEKYSSDHIALVSEFAFTVQQ